MKTNTTIHRLFQATFAALLLAAGGIARAGDAGHYVGGMMDTRDYFLPDPGFYAALYNYFYTADRYNDASGSKVSSIAIGPGPAAGTTLNASINLNMYVLAPALIWVSPWEILGAKYGAYVAPTFANASIQNAVYNSRGAGVTGSQATFAPGDMFVQPLWLGWTRPHWDRSRLRLLRSGRQIQHRGTPRQQRQGAGIG